MLKIRLMRIGDKKKPFYRIVVVDERNKRTGGNIEVVGTYNPLTEPKDIKLKKDRIEHWIKMGAQKSHGFLRILGEAPQRKPRKPKKEKKEPSVVSPQSSEKVEAKNEEPEQKAPVEQISPVIPSEAQESQDSKNTEPTDSSTTPQNDKTDAEEGKSE